MDVSIVYQFYRIWFKSLAGVSPCKSRSVADNAVYAARSKQISSRYHFDLTSLCRRTHHPPHKSPLGARISYPKPHLSIQTTTPSHPRHTLTSPHPPIKQIPNLPVRLHLLRTGPSRVARATDIRLAGHASHIEAIRRFLRIQQLEVVDEVQAIVAQANGRAVLVTLRKVGRAKDADWRLIPVGEEHELGVRCGRVFGALRAAILECEAVIDVGVAGA